MAHEATTSHVETKGRARGQDREAGRRRRAGAIVGGIAGRRGRCGEIGAAVGAARAALSRPAKST
jgi:hypothetical protein